MYQKEFTEISKVAYLCCCRKVRLAKVLAPDTATQKARFLIEAPFEGYLELLEQKWDNPKKAGKPGIPDARKYFFKVKQYTYLAKALCQKARNNEL